MNITTLRHARAFALALTLAAGLAAPALAASATEQTAATPQVAVPQSAGAGPYDQSDRFLDARGYPLPGDEIASDRDPAS
jgi:hypothetical protein